MIFEISSQSSPPLVDMIGAASLNSMIRASSKSRDTSKKVVRLQPGSDHCDDETIQLGVGDGLYLDHGEHREIRCTESLTILGGQEAH